MANVILIFTFIAIGDGMTLSGSINCKKKIVLHWNLCTNDTFKINKAKQLYGDHCQVDSDCSSKLNYECQNGVCNCTSTSYYESASEGCG